MPDAPWLPNTKVNLGLDLRGGSYLLLEADFDAYLKDQAANLVDDIRNKLRDKKIGYTNLSSKGDKLSFNLREIKDLEEAKKQIKDISRDFDITNNEAQVEISFSDDYKKELKRKVIEQSIEIVRRRVDETGTREPIIQRQGDLRVLLQVPGVENPDALKRIMGRTAKMTFHLMDESDPFPSGPRPVSSDMMLIKGEEGSGPRYYVIQKKAMLTGDMLLDASTGYDDSGLPAVHFRFNTQGARKFGDITRDNVDKHFAIVLDNKVITSPVIRSPILGGSGQISGNFTVESANELSLLLRAGALPAPLNIIEERSVGPSLGQDSIEAGKKASIIGVALVMGFMIINYGLFGVFANVALIVNVFLILAFLSLLGATLTLPGIAGIVLTLGMAVDANVLIYERIREEMRAGKSLIYCLDQGFKRAFGTIFDSNITTLVATLFLFIFGAGPVKGFAVTLTIGIIASMFTAIVMTKALVAWWLTSFKPKAIPI